ncbi:hypothetical protein HY993_04790 [Candidatus Micrarchaeota archaeon]|nr:hypothetical protein [Candidatus Micrarchaeota archaeon]
MAHLAFAEFILQVATIILTPILILYAIAAFYQGIRRTEGFWLVLMGGILLGLAEVSEILFDTSGEELYKFFAILARLFVMLLFFLGVYFRLKHFLQPLKEQDLRLRRKAAKKSRK